MDKVDFKRGLIRYDTESRIEAAAQGRAESLKLFRVRTFVYMGVLAIVGGIMLYGLLHRSPLDITVLHDRNPVFVQLSSGKIRNGYTLKIQNKTHEHRTYVLDVDGLDGARISVKAAGDITSDTLYVPADSVGSYHIYVSADVEVAPPREIVFTLASDSGDVFDDYDSVFITRKGR